MLHNAAGRAHVSWDICEVECRLAKGEGEGDGGRGAELKRWAELGLRHAHGNWQLNGQHDGLPETEEQQTGRRTERDGERGRAGKSERGLSRKRIVNNFMSSPAIIYAILLTLCFCCNSCVAFGCLSRRGRSQTPTSCKCGKCGKTSS